MENEKKYNSDTKIVFYSFIATFQKHAVNKLQKIQKKYSWLINYLSNKTKFSQSFYRDNVLYWKKNILLWWLKYFAVFYFNICSTVRASSIMVIILWDPIPERCKFAIKENYEKATSFIIYDYHLIKSSIVI